MIDSRPNSSLTHDAEKGWMKQMLLHLVLQLGYLNLKSLTL